MLRSPKELPWRLIATPLASAEDAVARLDERLAKSPIRAGWQSRTHFTDAAASIWLEGDLVPLEDLVLHDAGHDVRAPTLEVVRATAVLQARRRIFIQDGGWALSPAGLSALRGDVGAADPDGVSTRGQGDAAPPVRDRIDDEDEDEENVFAKEFAALDAVLARSARALQGVSERPRDPLVYDEEFDDDRQLAAWREYIDDLSDLPPVLSAALALDAWMQKTPLQHKPWLGTLLASSLLRANGKARQHLPTFNVGLRAIAHERRRARDDGARLVALIEAIKAAAEQGLKDHDRWSLAHGNLTRKLLGRRSTSQLPAVVDFVMSRPLVSTTTLAAAVGVSSRAAQNLVAELGLRELTGRGRFRAWAVL